MSTPPWKPGTDPVEIARMVRWYVHERASLLEISRHYGCAHKSVRKALQRAGVSIRTRRQQTIANAQQRYDSIAQYIQDHVEIDPVTECWIMGTGRSGRAPQVCIDGQILSGPRESWKAFRGPIPDGHRVWRHCRNYRCVCPDHLRCGSVKQQTRQSQRGRKWSLATRLVMLEAFRARRKLSDTDATEIRASSEGNEALARRFGVTRGQIRALRNGETYQTRESILLGRAA